MLEALKSAIGIAVTAGFALSFISYYLIAWKIRSERLRGRPSYYRLLSNPFFIDLNDLTERGQRLYGRLILNLVVIALLGFGAIAVHQWISPLP